MPEITFILPHWAYWGAILAVPAGLMAAARMLPRREKASGRSAALAYFFLLTGGFAGMHRLYLKNAGAVFFIALFFAVLYCNDAARQTRNAHSIARNEVSILRFDLQRAEEDGADAAEILEMEESMADATAREELLATTRADWQKAARGAAALILLMILADAVLLPRLLRRARRAQEPPPGSAPAPEISETAPEAPEIKNETLERGKLWRAAAALNSTLGEFVSYWTVLAVFVFYYEVVARYVFNSPTIWAHESMFLLFGMQYMLAGGFCLRHGAHVRVDVLYGMMPPRARAVADVLTSVFFFIFAAALAVTGWIFFRDSFAIREASFTEWAIPYYPIKFMLPLGGALLFLQGAGKLLQDIAALRGRA